MERLCYDAQIPLIHSAGSSTAGQAFAADASPVQQSSRRSRRQNEANRASGGRGGHEVADTCDGHAAAAIDVGTTAGAAAATSTAATPTSTAVADAAAPVRVAPPDAGPLPVGNRTRYITTFNGSRRRPRATAVEVGVCPAAYGCSHRPLHGRLSRHAAGAASAAVAAAVSTTGAATAAVVGTVDRVFPLPPLAAHHGCATLMGATTPSPAER